MITVNNIGNTTLSVPHADVVESNETDLEQLAANSTVLVNVIDPVPDSIPHWDANGDYLAITYPDFLTELVNIPEAETIIGDKTEEVINTLIGGTGGAGMIGSSSGNTVQQELDAINGSIRSLWNTELADIGYNLVDGNFEVGATVTGPLDAILDRENFSAYSWNGTYPKVVPANSTVASTGGISPTAWQKITNLSIGELLASTLGASKIGIEGQGTLQNTIVTVFVDAYGADPSGLTSSTAAVINAAKSINGAVDSAYVTGETVYGRVVFGPGTYLLGDVPFFSGIVYQGQGEFVTRILPEAGKQYCFTTTGTTTATGGGDLKRLFCAGLTDMNIGCSYYEDKEAIPVGVGGVKISYASYMILQNLNMRRVNGTGLHLDEVWDSDFNNVRMMYVGNVTDVDNPVPALYIGRGTGSDGSNALRFSGLHIEACPKSMDITRGTRHVFFTSPKIEAGTVSSTITDCLGVTFDCAELSWFSQLIPQFDISRSDVADSSSIVFETPTMISNSNRGWYFKHSSNAGALLINSPVMRQIATLVTGSNFQINGGTSYDSGPMLVKGTGISIVTDFNCIALKATVAGDGTDDTIIISGLGNRVQNCSFNGQPGSISDGSAFINVMPTASDAIVIHNSFHGTKQYGVRQQQQAAWVYDNKIINSGILGSLLSVGTPNYTLLNKTMKAYNVGELRGDSIVINSGATANLAIIAGASDISLRVQASTLNNPSAKLFLDTNSTVFNLVATTSPLIINGSGTAGDGNIYLTKSGANLVIANFTAFNLTFYTLTTSVVS